MSDTIGSAEFVRLRGSVDYPLEAGHGDFVLWRREIRDEAKRLDIRVSVIRSGDIVLVHNPPHESSQDEFRATMAVIGSLTADLLAQSDEPPTAATSTRRFFESNAHASASSATWRITESVRSWSP